ncbi:imidazole glycerol phosphate synthase subunit HisH [Rosistilla oblonga]|uniref:Imidazole glycerol phosphate synthase subunit HisH n=1 Tax=Rosistilla oblonga TaxID=2527990 RepID=A0A518IQ55_9BACT|nr:imidazole glycerol phosphate synthase subunit HisH [Rosistilla oblonga]QDV55221.1 Imidazole glycerol phosphate synthase subunit HisH 1 [Rosistilla oblonga]
MITILSYGSGNVNAIANIFSKEGIPFEIAGNANSLANASKVVLPGVGAFDQTMDLLNESGMRETLDQLVLSERIPVLGVCVGMQVMAKRSDEGIASGLGWIDAVVKQMDTSSLDAKPYLPHMGWNSIHQRQPHRILDGVDEKRGFYFLHSYCFHSSDPANILTTTVYGQEFCSSVVAGNIFGFQFHPEKSHSNGIRLFKNFAEL